MSKALVKYQIMAFLPTCGSMVYFCLFLIWYNDHNYTVSGAVTLCQMALAYAASTQVCLTQWIVSLKDGIEKKCSYHCLNGSVRYHDSDHNISH